MPPELKTPKWVMTVHFVNVFFVLLAAFLFGNAVYNPALDEGWASLVWMAMGCVSMMGVLMVMPFNFWGTRKYWGNLHAVTRFWHVAFLVIDLASIFSVIVFSITA